MWRLSWAPLQGSPVYEEDKQMIPFYIVLIYAGHDLFEVILPTTVFSS